MNSTRLGFGIVLLVFASSMPVPAMALAVEPSSLPGKDREVASESRPVPPATLENESDLPGLKPELILSAPSAALPAELEQPDNPSILDLENDFLECCPPGCVNPCPCFYGLVEALFFMRNPRLDDQAIVVDPNTGTTFLSTSDLLTNFNPGLRATFGMRLCGGRAVEFEYLGLFAATNSAVAVQPDPSAFLIFPDNFFGNVFVDMSRVEMNYASGLQGIAINFPCCCGCCEPCTDECGCSVNSCQSYEWFGGFRYLNLNETLNLAAQRIVGGETEEGNYNIRTNNNLYGAQLGARFRRTSGRFGYEATGTAGIFGNSSRQTQAVTDFPNFPIRPSVSSSKNSVAFVGWANLSGLYLLNDVWNLRAGYNLLWIEGVALAPDQLDFDFASSPSGNQLNSGGGLLLHGINVGVEARW